MNLRHIFRGTGRFTAIWLGFAASLMSVQNNWPAWVGMPIGMATVLLMGWVTMWAPERDRRPAIIGKEKHADEFMRAGLPELALINLLTPQEALDTLAVLLCTHRKDVVRAVDAVQGVS